MNVFFGRGRRVQFLDGTLWRIKSGTFAQFIIPIISSPEGRVADSGPLPAKRSYGINTTDGSYTIFPIGFVDGERSSEWVMTKHEREVATVDARAGVLTPIEPVPIAGVLLAFTLISHGIPGEGKLLPSPS